MGLKNDRSFSNATVEDRKRTRLDAYGFPRGYLFREKQVHGFATGDMVLADVPSGKKKVSPRDVLLFAKADPLTYRQFMV